VCNEKGELLNITLTPGNTMNVSLCWVYSKDFLAKSWQTVGIFPNRYLRLC
jgi:hypothetical protein